MTDDLRERIAEDAAHFHSMNESYGREYLKEIDAEIRRLDEEAEFARDVREGQRRALDKERAWREKDRAAIEERDDQIRRLDVEVRRRANNAARNHAELATLRDKLEGAHFKIAQQADELVALRDEVARLRRIERLADAASLAYGRSDGRIIPEMDPSEPTEKEE